MAAAIPDIGGDGVLHVDDMVVANPVQLGRGHARLHVRRYDLEHFGGQAAGNAHVLDVFGGFEGNGHGRIIADFIAGLNEAGALPAPEPVWRDR
jgi:hypothetical protein